ncbi:MAG TPA: hypothetical protein DCY86_15235 [Bdellovibrionales bacterium]|nr:hypothetical protein [Bdellovibrionales bacterium]
MTLKLNYKLKCISLCKFCGQLGQLLEFNLDLTWEVFMRCHLTIFALLTLLFTFGALAQEDSNPFTTDLMANGGSPDTQIDVGDVSVWNNATTLFVRYQIVDQTPADQRDNLCLSQTQMHIARFALTIPQTLSGSPKIEKFHHKTEHTPCVTDYTYQIPMKRRAGKKLVIATHAEVRTQFFGLEGFASLLPDTATIHVSNVVAGGPSYFPALTVTDGAFLNGVYHGWCVDSANTISRNFPLTASIYSSYEPLPEGTVDFPQNFDLVNWILNQHYVDQTSASGQGVYTYGDLQKAIWTLLDDETSTSSLGVYNEERVQEILTNAKALGENFVPGCKEIVAIVFDPKTSSGAQQQVLIGQATAADLGVACETRKETSWGKGKEFRGKLWAEYFNYHLQ